MVFESLSNENNYVFLIKCVVLENIHTPTMEGIRNSKALGWVVESPIKLTQAQREFSLQSFWWGVLFILFALQFWAVVISNYTKH